MWNCPPSTILVPVDFGDASARAVELAAAIAARLGSRLRVLHVENIEAPPYFTHEQMATIERERNAAREQARKFLRDFAKAHGADPVQASIAEGSAVAAIVEAARETDLVVMGTHGRRGPSRWWMGSVAERVAHESPAPVPVVRANHEGVALSRIFERPLVVAGSEAAEASRVASGLAQAFGGRVSDVVARCEADVARERGATVMVVANPASVSGLAISRYGAEQWIRSCALPMLFVPGVVPERV